MIGNPEILRRAAAWCNLHLQLHEVTDPAEGFDGADGSVPIYDPAPLMSASLMNLPVGKVSELAGDASVRYVIAAIDLALASRVDGIVTAPINKEAINAAGHRFAGHTELLASRTGVREAAMMLVTGALRVIHVTTHVAFAQVPVIAPAISRASSHGITASGPWPPDTIFARAARGQFDGVVAMYHDQGHIAVKMLGFDEGVNVSLGLPIVRTSVDHGTAFDIAGQG
ncbi:MAG: 4-hydroxythreonine-4-phosphate dehydrogenase PdxA, partial [Chloroflexi bacterium]|nr:4-hydroxythreonine-4-phosphate dehydrogenase PdxA [Chloroflexota bacterium]